MKNFIQNLTSPFEKKFKLISRLKSRVIEKTTNVSANSDLQSDMFEHLYSAPKGILLIFKSKPVLIRFLPKQITNRLFKKNPKMNSSMVSAPDAEIPNHVEFVSFHIFNNKLEKISKEKVFFLM